MADIIGTDNPETLDGTVDADTITALGGDDTINAGDGADIIYPGSGRDTVNAEDGDDTIILLEPNFFGVQGGLLVFDSYNGGAGTDTLELRTWTSPNTHQTFPFGPTDIYSFSGNLSSIERLAMTSTAGVSIIVATSLTALTASGVTDLVGGAGYDLLTMSVGGGGSFTMPSLNLTNWTSSATPHLVYGDVLFLNAAGIGDFTLNALEGLAATQGLTGGDGNDTLNGSSGIDILNGLGGANTLNGGGGNDVLQIMNSTAQSGAVSSYTGTGSTFNGDAGFDVFSIGGVVDFGGTLSSVEAIHLQPAFASALINGWQSQVTANLTMSGAAMAALPANLELQGTGLITVNLAAGAALDASGYVRAAGSSVVLLFKGSAGDDTVEGSSGNDGFYFGSNLTAADAVDGGAGSNDQLGLQGDYGIPVVGSSPYVFGANNLANIEVLVLLPGDDTRFGDTAGNDYGYNLFMLDANVGAGQVLSVNFNTLRSSESVIFYGADELDGSFLTFGGLGPADLTGGQQSDGFYFGADRWTLSNLVDGRNGADDQLGLQGNYSGANAIVFDGGQLVGIETIAALTGGDSRFGAPAGFGYSYDFLMDDGNVAAGAVLTINANTLRADVPGIADETLTFDGVLEFDGNFIVYGGAGDDWMRGSRDEAGDQFWGGAGNDTLIGLVGADDLRGGAGNDTFEYHTAGDSTALAMDEILDYATGDKIRLTTVDANSIVGGNQDFSFIGAGAFTSVAGQLRVADIGGGHWQVQGDINGDGAADFIIAVTTDHALIVSDFVL